MSRLITPLGVTHTFTLPEDVLRFRSALGHLEEDGAWHPAGQWGLTRACGPAGLISATAADVIAFARMHIDGGRAHDGTQVLSPKSVAAMRKPQVAIPDPYTMGSHFGIGWVMFDGDGPRMFGHNGGTIGQIAFLRMVPDAGVAIVLLTNGGHAVDLYDELVVPLLEELAQVTTPPALELPAVAPEFALDPYVGVYERLGSRIEIHRGDRGLFARLIATGPLADVFPAIPDLDLVPVGQNLFVTRQEGEHAWTAVVFYRLEDGSPYVHFALRATPKIG
jgi:CubicO group peptidase (beta-lactamase class C family)